MPLERAELHRALVDLRASLDDADAVTRDLLRRPRRRELGPRLHARNYHEAYRKMDELLAYLLRSAEPPPADGGSITH